MEKVTILIADDHRQFREGIKMMLRRETNIEVVGEALTGLDAIRMASMLQPDLVLMDLQMPDMNGIDSTREIVAASPHIRVLVFTMHDDDDFVFAAIRSGARGYLLKGADKAEVLRAIRAVHSGEAIFGPAIAARLTHYFSSPTASPAAVAFPELTEREREILNMITRGFSNQDISNRLMVSLKTVRNHVSNIFNKLQISDRAQAVVLAQKRSSENGGK